MAGNGLHANTASHSSTSRSAGISAVASGMLKNSEDISFGCDETKLAAK